MVARTDEQRERIAASRLKVMQLIENLETGGYRIRANRGLEVADATDQFIEHLRHLAEELDALINGRSS